MRLFLLPVSTRRTLLYCERQLPASAILARNAAQRPAGAGPADSQTIAARHATATGADTPLQAQPPQEAESLLDKAQARAARMWADWEKKPDGSWQRRLVSYGNAGFRRIPLEEWGLKSVPPLRRQQQEQDPATAGKVEVVFPPSLVAPGSALGLLHRLSTEREALHRQRILWCFIGMPITIPIAILPVIPNIPFFYLVYRAWSYWRAIAGGKHVQYLVKNDLLTLAPSPTLDAIYASEKAKRQLMAPAAAADEVLLTNPGGAKAIADELESAQLELELERAIWQVETAQAKEHTVPSTEEKSEKKKSS